MSKKYNLRKDTDLRDVTFEDILTLTKSLEKKAEPIDFSGFKTPSPPESLHLDKIFSTDSLTSGFSTPTIMELDITGIKSDWESRKGDLDGKLDELFDLFDDFGPIADEFSVHGGSFTPVEEHWKKCHTAFQGIKIVERALNKYNESELEKRAELKEK